VQEVGVELAEDASDASDATDADEQLEADHGAPDPHGPEQKDEVLMPVAL
jgi:hypothetical protein